MTWQGIQDAVAIAMIACIVGFVAWLAADDRRK